MANTWNIIIEPLGDGTVAFRPDLCGAQQGQPLDGVESGDSVNWNNTTDLVLELVSIDPPGIFLTDPIRAHKVSDPDFIVSKTVTYACVKPSQQQHSIEVVPPYRKDGKGGKGAGPWSARPWSDQDVYVEGGTTTVVLDRRTAENVYYALALALGRVDRP